VNSVESRLSVALFLFLLFICGTGAASSIAERPGEPKIRVAELERRIHDLVNNERAARNLIPLELDEGLSKVARAHSQDMARRRFFDHLNPDGRSPADRGKRAGYRCSFGENLYQSNLYSRIRIRGDDKFYDWNTPEDIALESVHGWMRSEGHRRNILQKDYSRAGLGVAIAADDKVYITQLFCARS
jgi:uncharacterized protein YkwD